jgi:RND family efflux transporter MFP subunit
MNRPPFRSLTLAALVALSAAVPSLSVAETASAVRPALTVEVVAPETRLWSQPIPANGWLAPWQEAVISAEASLKIVAIDADVGSVVRKGDVLVRLEQDSVLADLGKQEAALATAEANLTSAKANADRARRVKGSGALSEQQATDYLVTERTAEAALRSEKAGLAGQKIKLEQTVVRAVDDGVISSRSASLGAVVSPGSELFRLIRQGRVEWQAEVAAQFADRLKPGVEARVTLAEGRSVVGHIRMTAPTASKDTGRVTVYVELPAGSGARAGVNVSGVIELPARTALTVPESALVFDDGLTYLYTAGADDRVTRRKVTVGRRAEGRAEILSGLAADAAVVRSGGAFLSDGVTVTVVAGTEAAR